MKNVMVNTSVKRLAMAIALVWCVMLGVKAQAVLFHESFDSGVLPTGWTIVDANNDGYNWDASFRYQQNPSAAHSGDGMIASMSSYVYGVGTITPDNWLISPAINIPDGAVLTFWIKGQESSSYYAENYSVYVASSNNVTELEATTPLLTKSAFNDWEEQVVDLSSFAGQTVYIAFRHLGATNIYWLGLDDVEVRKPSISVSSEMLDFGQVPLFRERTVPIMVKGYNLRSPITVSTTAPFYVSVDSVSFVNTVTIRENGVLFVKYVPTSVSNANSMISLASDTVLETITVKGSGVDCSQRKVVPYSEQFEGDWFPPVCWNLISQQDKTWTKISKWASCLGSNDNKIEQLETCVFDFSQVSNNLLMSFDFQSNDYYVTYNYVDLKIYVSKDGGSTYESTPIWTLSSYGSFNSWTTTTAIVDISGLAGESNIRFKFSYEGRLCQVVFCNLQIKEIPVSPERVVYVKSGATGSNDGTSWNNAFTDLQEAINQVYGLDSLSIWVAAGTYFGDTTKTTAFKVSKSKIINIFGGFAGDEPANYDLSMRDFETNATVLDGLHNRQVLYVSSYNPDYPMVFDGFTLQNGVADQGGGAEMYGKVTLSNCIIQYNTSNNSGGGVYCYDANEILNCKICYNHGRYGGGISSYLTDVSNCVICNNLSSYDGGGFSSSHDKVSNCLINNNTSGQSGGGIVSRESEIINTTIVRNTAISNGAGISVGEYSSSNISNSIVWGNMRGDSLDNFYGNGLQCYACAMDGESVGAHAIVINNDNTYPCYVNPSNISGYEDTTSNVDWHLTQWSPCVNRGENMLVSRLKDLDNMPRIQVDTVDMGCYESGYTNTQPYPFEGIVYVTPTGSGTGSGDSWNNAMSSLQDAITLAQSRSCVVWVAAGTYFGNTDSAAMNAFTMINGVNVYGGFAGNEPENYDLSLRDFETNSTILDGQNTRRVLYQKSDFGVETVWDGFTIQNGLVRNEAGGGVYLCGNSILKHCLVRNNEIEGSSCGGGIYAYGSSSHKTKIVQCTVSNNISYSGAGICAHYALIESSRVTHNKSIYYGGGMSTSNCKIINCQIANNTSTEAAAGGIEANNDTIINTTIVRNSSAYRDVGAGLSGYARMYNCIMWGNETDGVSNNLRGSGDMVVCSHCAIEGGFSGENMVLLENGSNVVNFVNPSLSAGVFDSTANVDWHLAPTSIFINRGDNSFVTDSVDLAGIARIKRDTVDLGCYESDCYSVPMTEYNGIVYVTQTGAGTRSGNCWANATASFSHAQLIAQTYNAVVWVAAGTYYGDTTLNSENAFSMVEGVKVYGGFVGNESPEYDLTLRDFEVNATILDGQNKRKVLNRPNDYNTVVRETVWDGFTIQNGFGGGVSMSDNTILRNCLVRYNEGGGITASGSSNRKAKIRYCTVENNTSSSNGAGIYAYYTDIEHCVVAYNYYSEDYYGGGGGIYAYGSEVKNTEVFKNRSNAYGGGILISERSQVKNCLVANNSSKNNEGSGISGNGDVTNTTIVRNASASNGAGVCITGKLVNCIVWGNQDNSGLSNNVQGDNVQCLYSAIEDDYERDNIVLLSEYNNQYPHFVRPSLTVGAFDTTANVDWHLMSNSVCINRGLNTALYDSLDLDGTARIKRDTVDLGCYESDYNSIPLTEYNGVVYVTESGAGNRSGNSWSNAMSSVRMAMTLAKSYNLMVWVASGTYYGDVDSTSENAFTMMDGVNVYGGFIGNESANFDLSMRDFEANATILDGQNRKRVLYQPSDFNTKTTWDGFVIQNGYVNGNGGGVFMRNNAVLSHCLVQNNISTTPYSDDWRNTEVRYGGGIYAVGFTNTNPITRPVIRRCRIKNNKVENNNSYSYNSCHGAGVYASCINIENSEVFYNMTQGSGGGLFLNSQCFVNNCLIANNTSNSYGGGVNINMGSEIVNSTIVRNASGYEGAGVNFSSSSSSYKNTMTNCIVWGNRKQDGTTSNIQGNYILCSNTAVEDDFEREGVILLSEHNNQHPQFANPSLTAGWTDSTENVDWHLQQGSICINRGDNAAVMDSVDLDEMVRIKRDTVDLGCYESDYFSTPLTEYSGIVYVTQTGAGDFSGNSWENAKSSIHGAQLLSSVYDAVVWVAAGTYYGDTASDAENAFTMYDGVNVYGGFAGNEPANYDLSLRDFETNATILDGQNARRVLYQPENFNTRTSWDGFTIQNGYANGPGGGVYMLSNARLANCLVQDNVASVPYNNQGTIYGGGGVCVRSSSDSSEIAFCRIRNNETQKYGSGGGVWASHAVILHSDIVDNRTNTSSSRSGGGVYASFTNVLNCTIVHNTAQEISDGYYNHSYGGGIYLSDATVVNSLIAENSAYYGGGVCGYGDLFNTTVVSNNADNYAGVWMQDGDYRMVNSVLWGNRRTNGNASNLYVSYGACQTIHSAVEGGISGNDSVMVLSGENSGLDAGVNYPFFVSPQTGDYRLCKYSALVNAGDNGIQIQETDLSDMPRVFADTIDIGCYEFHGEAFCATPQNLAVSDISGTSALLTWQNPNPDSPYAYEFSYKSEDENQWTSVLVYEPEYYVLTGLQAQTIYAIRMRTLCDDVTPTEYTSEVFFSTKCTGETAASDTIGNTSTTTNGHIIPIRFQSSYSYSQQIYQASEIAGERILDTLKLRYQCMSSGSTLTRNVDIYLGHTDRPSFDDNAGFVTLDSLTLLYSGDLTLKYASNNPVISVPLDKPFRYNGVDNLIIAFDDNTGTDGGTSRRLCTHRTQQSSSLHTYSYNGDIDPANPTAGTLSTYRMNLILPGVCENGGCDLSGLSLMGVTENTATLLVQAGTNADGVEVQYKERASDEYLTIPVDSLMCQLTGLRQNTDYVVRARSVCGDTSSLWTYRYFTTEVKDFARIYVTMIGQGEGNSWATACNDLNYALSTASRITSVFGHTPDIWVAAGTYYGDTASTNAFTMAQGANVYGGFVGNEPSDYDVSLRDVETNATVLDGRHSRRVLLQPSAFTVQTTWDGFTIQNGNISSYGGGAYLRSRSYLSHCKLVNNHASYGGGAYVAGYGSVIRDCRVSDNSAVYKGGGIQAMTYSTVANCVISGNSTTNNVYYYYGGGGIYAEGATIVSCEISNNSTVREGGAVNMTSSQVRNCLLANNSSNNAGGGVHGSGNIINSTIVNNRSGNGVGGLLPWGPVTLTNSIVWGNQTGDGTPSNLSDYNLTCSHSAIEDGSEGDSVIVLNDINQPLFVNPSLTAGANDFTVNVDWHLQQASVCINRGDNSAVTDTLDLDGNARIQRDTVDMGCYESDYYSVPMTEYDSIIYVTVTGAGTQLGDSWANATSSIEEAQTLAQTYGAVVWVAAGTYYGDTTATNTFTMRDGVNVYGGFAGNEPADYDLSLRDFEANATILDGMNARRVLYQPFEFNGRTVWNGFTIRNGQTSGDGAGAYLRRNAVLSQCRVQGNVSSSSISGGGGGVYCNNASVDKCNVYGNTSLYNGGGVYATNSTVSDCRIERNAVSNHYPNPQYYGGGGIRASSSTITGCRIKGNQSAVAGGGVFSSGAVLSGCEILENTAVNRGGGINLTSSNSRVTDCLVGNNTATNVGGGISGGGMVVNTTIVRNTSTGDGAGVNGTSSATQITLTNCIVWGNERNGTPDNIRGNLTCSYSAIEGGHEGDSIIVLNNVNPPLFVNPSLTAGASDSTANVDWHLQQGSVCINRGDNSVVTDSLDLDGTARIKRDTVDLGCYESDFYSVPVLYCTTVYGEFAATACDSYSWNDQVFSHSGDYQQTFPLANGCDSIATLHLTVHHAATTREYLTVCASDLPYLYGDTLLDISTPQSLIISSQRQTQYGCDSTVILFLTVTPSTVGNFAAMTPTNNYPVSAYPIRFTWDAVENASNYDLYVWPVGEPQPQQPTASHIHGTSYTLSSLANRGAYQWFMTAYNACDTSVSTARQFTLNVTPTLTVNTNNPVDMGEVQLNGARSIWFQVNGNALDSVITYQLTGSDSAAFALVPTATWDSLRGGRMQLTFHPTVAQAEYTAQMIFYSDTLVRSFTIKGHLSDYLTFTTYVDTNIYAMDSEIPIHGRVTNPLNEPVAGLEVEVYVNVMDYVRTFPAISDANGQFTVMFTPQHSEAGYYTVGSRRAGGNSTAVHDDFNIPGMMLASSDWILWEPTIDQPDTGVIAVRNRSRIPLTNIQVTPVSLPNGCTVQFVPLNLAGLSTGELQYTVRGTQVSTGSNYEEARLNAICEEGAAMDFTAWYYCLPQRADLDVTPTSLTTTMTKGNSKVVDFKIYNNGTGPTGNITVSLPDVPWMSVVGSDTLPSLAVHDSAYVSIRLSADSTTALVRHTGNFAINCERGEGVSIPYSITAISDSTGTLLVDVTDEYTWNTNGGHGPHLAGANVTVKGYYSLETVATGVTDANGHFVVNDLPEGWYKLIVRADKHEEYQNNLYVTADDTNRQDIFIQFQAITYSWEVVPTDIQDEYTYELNAKFETHVPKPVIVLHMPEDIPELAVGESYTFNYVLTNHGLVAAFDVRLFVPENTNYSFSPLYDRLDSLPAQTSIVIPCVMSRPAPTRSANANRSNLPNRSGSGRGSCPQLLVTKAYSYYTCAGEHYPIWSYVIRNAGNIPCSFTPSVATPTPSLPSTPSSGHGGAYGDIYLFPVITPLTVCECKDDTLRDTTYVTKADTFLFINGTDDYNYIVVYDTFVVVCTNIIICNTGEITYYCDTLSAENDGSGSDDGSGNGDGNGDGSGDGGGGSGPDCPDCPSPPHDHRVTYSYHWNSGEQSIRVSYNYPFKGVVADGASVMGIEMSCDTSITVNWVLPEYNGLLNSTASGTIKSIFNMDNERTKWMIEYQAPSEFPMNVSKEYTAHLHIEYVIADSVYHKTLSISVIRPPVLFVHGLGGKSDCFIDLYNKVKSEQMYDDWQLCRVDYSERNASEFVLNERVIQENIYYTMSSVACKGYVVSKADIIGHSMGGVLARLHVQNVSKANVHKIITVNTPHSGSSLANFIMNDRRYKLLALAYYGELGAVKNLQVSDYATTSFLNNPYSLYRMNGIPIHALASTTTFTYSDNLALLIKFAILGLDEASTQAVLTPSFGFQTVGFLTKFALSLIPKTIRDNPTAEHVNGYLRDIIFGDNSDLVVSLNSQRGGLSGLHSIVLPDEGLKTSHTEAKKSANFLRIATDLLKRPVTDARFCTTGFRPIRISFPTTSIVASSPMAYSNNINRETGVSTLNINASLDTVNRQLNVLINSIGTIDSLLTFGLWEDKILFMDEQDSIVTTIPPTCQGDVRIFAVGINNVGEFVVDSTIVSISGFGTIPQEISFIEETLYVFKDATVYPTVRCTWANGDTTYVTPTFTVDSSTVIVENDAITGNHSGTTILTAQFENLTTSIPVIVNDWNFIDNDDDSTTVVDNDSLTHNTLCASVTVQFSQTMTMTREAFEGTLTIDNGHESQPMQNIDVNFVIKDESGTDCTNLFQINFLSYNNMTGTNGNASLDAQNQGSIVVQFIPTKQAAPTMPKQYSFGGSFSFIDPFTGESMTYDLYPVDIMVNPSPDLYVNYFMQRDILGDDPLTEDRIEPIIPAELGVIIHNRGAGTAMNVLLETAEPEIIDNEKGLAIDFAMYGAALNGNERQLGLMEIPFGNIEPGRTGVGEWWFTSTLLGHFVSYEAHVIHNNSFGNPDLSLVSSLDIHPLIHTVYAYGNLDDGINDFLVDDVEDSRNYPDSLYFSNGSRTAVATADSIGFDHYVTPSDTIVILTLDPSRIGWNYGQTWDPGRGQYELISCTRNSDHQEIPLSNVWQSYVTLPVGADPIYENKLHIVDTLSNDLPTTYTLVFSGFAVTIAGNEAICDGENATLTASGASSYSWSTGDTTETVVVNPTATTTYMVTGTNSEGRSTTATFTLTVNHPTTEQIEATVFESFTWNGQTYTTSGDYTQTFTAANGCDSVVMLHLTIMDDSLIHLPELHVTSISHSDLRGGETATISWIVRNDGTAPTPNGAVWYDRVWLSVENRVAAGDNNPIFLGEFPNVSALAPGEYYTQTQSIDIPISLSGSYFLFVITDAYDAYNIYWDSIVPMPYDPPAYIGANSSHCSGADCGNYAGNIILELSEINGFPYYHDNFFYELVNIAIPALPDLKVTTVFPISRNFFSGTPVDLSYTVTNDGNYDTRISNWQDVIFVSNHDEFDANARVLKTIPHNGLLLPDSSYSTTTTVTVPSEMYGTAYFYVYTDYYDQVYEHVGRYNNVSRSDSVNIILSPPADLVPRNILADRTVSTGATFNFSYEVHNQGAGEPNHSSWRDLCYLSADSNSITNAVQIADDWHYNGLNAGGSYAVQHSIALPSHLTQGTYYLFVQADAQNEVFEYTMEDNNLARFVQPVAVLQPDLQIPTLNVADILHAGAEASVAYRLANTGDGAVVNCDVKDGFYLSQSPDGSNATQLPQFTSETWLNAHDSTTKYQNVMLPSDLQDGTYYLFARTNIDNALNEANVDNNRSPIRQVYVNHQQLPDLVITSVTVPDTLTAGASATFTATIFNQGEQTATLNNLSFQLSSAATPNDIQSTTESVSTGSPSLAVGESTTVTMTIRISPAVNNPAPFTLTVNPNHTVSESSYSNNGYAFAHNVQPYPFDLAVTDLDAPGQIVSGEYINVEWAVQNQGLVPTHSLPMFMLVNLQVVSFRSSNMSQPWHDHIYLSSDTLLDSNDVQIGSYTRNHTLLAGDSYTANLNCRIPVASDGNYYVLVVSDATHVTFDSQRANNVKARPIAVTQSSLPDLQMDSLVAPNLLATGETCQIRYTVSNRGEHATHDNQWTDALYLNNTPSLQNAILLGSGIHDGQLDTNSSYTGLIGVTIPNAWEGACYLIGYTDATDQIYEMNNIDNNLFVLPVSVTRPLPCDLTVLPPDFPPSVNVGEDVQISWTLRNVGLNTAQGQIKEAVYLSVDSIWSSDDIMLGSETYAVNLNANAQVQRSTTLSLQGVPVGDYYVVVRSNILNALNENSYANNKAVSLLTMRVDYQSLYINQEEHRQLNSGQSVYYKLVVGPEYEHQTLSCKLTAPAPNVSNGLYIAYSSAPSASNFDWSATMPYVQEQEILIPSLNQGTYYIMATGQTANNAVQSVTLLATIVDFEIISVTANSGANTGSVTTQIIGAKFDTIMDFRLANSNGYLPAEKVFFHNSTETYATFNLRDQETGVYDMVAELPGGIITVKGQAFVVEQGLPAELLSNIIAPASVRSGNTFTVTIEYGNNGSADLNISGFLLVSTNGFPIAFSSDSLANNATELTFETGEPNGNPDVIRPGYFATKTIFVKANRVGNINLKLYPIRRQY